MNISYDQYKIFYRVAECRSITVAAEKLFVSQPAVSQTIRQLEEALGCALFLRTSKGVRLTAEGEVLYKYVSDGVNSFSEGERRLTAMLRLDAGEVRIGASDMTLEFCLLPYLEKFHTKYPKVRIAITNNPTPQTLELLAQGKIDFAAVSEPFDEAGLETIPLREIRDIFICAPEREIPENLSLDDIMDELILLERNTSTRAFLDGEFRKRGVCASPKFELATSPQIVGFAARNMGIGCVVSDFAKQAIISGKVREIQVGEPLPSRRICVIQGNDVRSIAADRLLDIITSPIAENNGAACGNVSYGAPDRGRTCTPLGNRT